MARLEEVKRVPRKDLYSKPFKSWISWDVASEKGEADPYQLIRKNEITVDKETGWLRNLRSCRGSAFLVID